MSLPGVSLLTPTYGRPTTGRLWFLEELVECYRRQDYGGPSELIILSDAGAWNQLLRCDVPGVRVVNEVWRYPSLGAKFNRLVGLARFDLLAPAEDDDLFLPHRLSLSVKLLGDGPYLNPRRGWLWTPAGDLQWQHPQGICHNMSIFTRAAFDAVEGGYKPWAQDTLMDRDLCKEHRLPYGAVPVGCGELPVKDWWYVYRWGHSDLHLSAFHPHEQKVWDDYGRLPQTPGTFDIRPRWGHDYLAARRRALPAVMPPFLKR
jgi:hypothetical protein